MITALMEVEEQGDRLTKEEQLTTLTALLVAGNDTARNLIGNGMFALIKNPEQLERLIDIPGQSHLIE